MEKSTHKAEVVRVHPRPHPNAERLELAEVFGYQVCVGKGDFADGELGVYLPPDSIVPAIEAFKFVWESKGYAPAPTDPLDVLATEAALEIPERYRRIKAKMLRGEISEGLLMPVRLFPSLIVTDPFKNYLIAPGFTPVKEGDDVATLLGIGHYEPAESASLRGDCEKAPVATPKRKKGYPRTLRGWFRFILSKLGFRHDQQDTAEQISFQIPAYDVDAWQRHSNIMIPGEKIWITEKIHGANSRFMWAEDQLIPGAGRMYAGSHYQWKKMGQGAWWECLKQNPWIESFCKAHPGFVLYGELIPTQKFKYGLEPGKYKLLAFDVLDTNQKEPGNNGKWLSFYDLQSLSWSYFYPAGSGLVDRKLLDEVHWVPTVAFVDYDAATIRKFSEGPSLVKGSTNTREGIVLKPAADRRHPRFGRVLLKIVSVTYLGSKQSDE